MPAGSVCPHVCHIPAPAVCAAGEVWCDNGVAVEYDEHGNAISYDELCAENYERYLLWSLVLPAGVFENE